MTKLFKCKYCGESFNRSSIGSHTANCDKNIAQVGDFYCKYCNRLFHKIYGLHHHESQCKNNPNRKIIKYSRTYELRDDLFCNFCNKQCKNINSLVQHEIRCKLNPNRHGLSNCDGRPAWNKGLTKETDARVAKGTETMYNTTHAPDYVNPNKGKPGTWLGKHHKESTKKKIGKSVSKSRLLGYANGTITPAKGVGRGKYSYLLYNSNKYMLRSTYEFIYAVYLIYNNIDFEFESVRVKSVRENRYSKTFLSDFKCDNTVIEIKGIPSGKDVYIKEAFESAGYEFKELFVTDILNYKSYLEDQGFNMDELLHQIVEGHNTKNYKVFDAADFRPKL